MNHPREYNMNFLSADGNVIILITHVACHLVVSSTLTWGCRHHPVPVNATFRAVKKKSKPLDSTACYMQLLITKVHP